MNEIAKTKSASLFSRVLIFLLMGSAAHILMACSNSGQELPNNYESQLSDSDAEQLLDQVIRYAGKLPARATFETRFSPEFDQDYRILADAHRIDLYHRSDDNREFLLVSRDAPSLYHKRVGIGIELVRNTEGDLTHYHEVFRTWKMTEDELHTKSGKLFAKMVDGEDLSPYYPENSGYEEYIEFPNHEAWFDTENRVWVSRNLETLNQMSGR